jgi:ParB/RepB/Spo0J family partition protein
MKRKAALAELTIDPVAVITNDRPTGARPGRLPLEKLYPDPHQPRRQFEPQTILELAADIAANGLLQPLRVRPPDRDGRHMILLGERRWRALQKIDGTVVADVIVDYDLTDDDAAFDRQLAENLQRDDLTRAEVAAAMLDRKERYTLTNEALARRYHKSVAWVDQHLRYAQLPAETRELMDRKGVDLKVAGVLQSLGEDANRQVVEAIAELPDQRTQLDFARTVRDLHGAGADLVTAVATARSRDATAPPSGAAAATDGHAAEPPARVGRPRAVVAPFEIRTDQRGMTWLMVRPQGLATSRLIGKRELYAAPWLQAIAEDLSAFRAACDAGGHADDWALVGAVLGPVTVPGTAGSGDVPKGNEQARRG